MLERINKLRGWFVWEATDVPECLFDVHEKPNCWMTEQQQKHHAREVVAFLRSMQSCTLKKYSDNSGWTDLFSLFLFYTPADIWALTVWRVLPQTGPNHVCYLHLCVISLDRTLTRSWRSHWTWHHHHSSRADISWRRGRIAFSAH